MPVLLTGDVLPFFTTVYDEAGVEVPAGSMKLTVTGPTVGSSATYDPVVPTTGPGSYQVDHPAPVAGRYVGRWLATGNNAGSDVQVFNVDDDLTFAPIVGLDEVKDHLNIPQDSMGDDEELWRIAGTASALVEAETRLWRRTTVTEQLTPRRVLYLTGEPVVSITSITQGSTTFAASDYTLTAGGGVTASTLGNTPPWMLTTSPSPVVVTYEAGETVVPSQVRDAVLLTVKSIWESQRGPANLPLQGSSGYEDEESDPSIEYALPYGAQKMLEPWAKTGAIA